MARLGELEHTIMEVLWSAGAPRTAREILDALPDRGLATTTVLTVLSRLERKGLVTRDRDGRAHLYQPAAAREDHIAALMREALDSAADRGAALARFADQVDEADAAALSAALQDAMRRRRGSA